MWFVDPPPSPAAAAAAGSVQPLERAARRLKENREVDLSEIASLAKYARFIMRMTIAAIASPICILILRAQIDQGESAVVVVVVVVVVSMLLWPLTGDWLLPIASHRPG